MNATTTPLSPTDAQALAAPGTAKGKITAGRIVPGMLLLTTPHGDYRTGIKGAVIATVATAQPVRHKGKAMIQVETDRGIFYAFSHQTVLLARDIDLKRAAKSAPAAPVESADGFPVVTGEYTEVRGIVTVMGEQKDAVQGADGIMRYRTGGGQIRKASPKTALTFRKTPDAPKHNTPDEAAKAEIKANNAKAQAPAVEPLVFVEGLTSPDGSHQAPKVESDAAPVFTLMASGAAKIAAHTGETVAQVEKAAKAQGWQVKGAAPVGPSVKRHPSSRPAPVQVAQAQVSAAVGNFRRLANALPEGSKGRAFWLLKAHNLNRTGVIS